MSFIPVILYQIIGLKWLAIPWSVVGLLGTATAFIVGFKNSQTYNRTIEANQIWTTILGLSRAWGLMCNDFINDKVVGRALVNHHLAWLTALRYQLREERVWESTNKKHNLEYQKGFVIPEKEMPLNTELGKYLQPNDFENIVRKRNISSQILYLQGSIITKIFKENNLNISQFLEFEKSIKDLFAIQTKGERLKDTPYPRQYAIINLFFVRLFCLLLPFGLLKEFDHFNQTTMGVLNGYMVWLVIPFSVVISWMYTSLEQVGESTENPFEGGANDVPISQISRMIEIELLELMNEQNLPSPFYNQSNIVL